MLYSNTLKFISILIVSFFISFGITEIIFFQFQTENISTPDLLDTLYAVLNLLLFLLTVLLIKLFLDEKKYKAMKYN
ncbi:hypothetical protein [Arcobacter sp.]|uniref:hypothetical protein n=1 Tax=Arcobacter sp. TaxID=1872629 RepID=UPI003D13018A